MTIADHLAPMSDGRRCVVTGGAGFIGSHLVEHLIQDNHQVTVIDNFACGRQDNLAAVADNPLLTVVSADVGDFDAIARHFTGAQWVFHLAALADSASSMAHPQAYHQANVGGTLNVLEAARQGKVKRFIYAASSNCYGIPDHYPTPEEAAIRPQNPHALTKWLGECYVQHWHQVYDLNTVSLRLFNVFGPRVRAAGARGPVFGVFMAQKLAGEPFTVVGDGTQTRDFTFVSDVVEALVLAARSNQSGAIFNVGSGGSYSIKQLVGLLGGPVTAVPRRSGEPNCTFADISRIEHQLGWHPRIDFAEGVAIMLAQQEQWRGAPLRTAETLTHETAGWRNDLGGHKVRAR